MVSGGQGEEAHVLGVGSGGHARGPALELGKVGQALSYHSPAPKPQREVSSCAPGRHRTLVRCTHCWLLCFIPLWEPGGETERKVLRFLWISGLNGDGNLPRAC